MKRPDAFDQSDSPDAATMHGHSPNAFSKGKKSAREQPSNQRRVVKRMGQSEDVWLDK
ncbi:hypothetical protein PO909_007652 [Leuciscus waleckii]